MVSSTSASPIGSMSPDNDDDYDYQVDNGFVIPPGGVASGDKDMTDEKKKSDASDEEDSDDNTTLSVPTTSKRRLEDDDPDDKRAKRRKEIEQQREISFNIIQDALEGVAEEGLDYQNVASMMGKFF